jgi:hypothetical protein
MPGFISWLGATVGDRMMTITAWESADAMAPLMKGRASLCRRALFQPRTCSRRRDRGLDPGPAQSSMDPVYGVFENGRLRKGRRKMRMRRCASRSTSVLVERRRRMTPALSLAFTHRLFSAW